MSRQYSPFAALSSREQQERWLEFQNTRLPYVNGEMETASEMAPEMTLDPPEPPNHREAPKKHIPHTPPVPQHTPTSAPLTFHQAQHRQYDAVIKRMTDAARQTQQFQSFPLS